MPSVCGRRIPINLEFGAAKSTRNLALIFFGRWITEIVVPTLKGGNFDQLDDCMVSGQGTFERQVAPLTVLNGIGSHARGMPPPPISLMPTQTANKPQTTLRTA